ILAVGRLPRAVGADDPNVPRPALARAVDDPAAAGARDLPAPGHHQDALAAQEERQADVIDQLLVDDAARIRLIQPPDLFPGHLRGPADPHLVLWHDASSSIRLVAQDLQPLAPEPLITFAPIGTSFSASAFGR